MNAQSWNEDDILALLDADPKSPETQAKHKKMMANAEARSLYDSFTQVELLLSSEVFERAEALEDDQGGDTLPENLKASLLGIASPRPAWFGGIFSKISAAPPTRKSAQSQGLTYVAMAAGLALVVGLSASNFLISDAQNSTGTTWRGNTAPSEVLPFFLVVRPTEKEFETQRVNIKTMGPRAFQAKVPITSSIQLRVYADPGLKEGDVWTAEGHLYGLKGGQETNKELLAGPQNLSAEGVVDDIDLSLGQAISLPALASRGYEAGDQLFFEVVRGQQTYRLTILLQPPPIRLTP